jgi:hypothetical protein
MDRVEVASAECEVPMYLRDHTETSLAARIDDLYRAAETSVHEADLKTILAAKPALMEEWQSYIEDQRTSDGWYVAVRNVQQGSPLWIVTRLRDANDIAFDSRVAAFAALIARIVGNPLCTTDSGT